MKHILLASLGFLSLSLTACPQEATSAEATSAEAREALTESSTSSQASDLTSSAVELSTNFTIGGAVEKAAGELRTFIGTQLPCADVQLANATLTVKYGAKAGSCFYNGHTFSGESSVTVARNEDGEVVVDHAWKDLSNGLIKVNGTAKVTWRAASKSRQVVHTLTWTRISDGRTGTGKGDRTQTALAGGVSEGLVNHEARAPEDRAGIKVDGTRTWDNKNGHWDMSIQGVEFRSGDPVPQAGKYVVVTPRDKTLSMSFLRLNADTIQVTVSSGSKTFKFNVHRAAGDVDDAA